MTDTETWGQWTELYEDGMPGADSDPLVVILDALEVRQLCPNRPALDAALSLMFRRGLEAGRTQQRILQERQAEIAADRQAYILRLLLDHPNDQYIIEHCRGVLAKYDDTKASSG
jgi:hypothetical protein